ncbi:MAG: hypothetical protein AB1489_42830 [Acidobacteriota bacterium]
MKTMRIGVTNAANPTLLYSSTATVVVPTAPAVPTNLHVVGQTTATQVNLAWTDNASHETSYVIERAIGSGGFAVLASLGMNVTGYSDTTVSAK